MVSQPKESNTDPISIEGLEDLLETRTDTPDPDRTRPDMSPTPDNRSHDSKRLVGVEVIALQTQLDVALSEIKHLKQELQGATFRNGYLEAQMEQSREQIKLLTDRQSKSRWAKFWAWFTGKAE
jgi:hypothetical protein